MKILIFIIYIKILVLLGLIGTPITPVVDIPQQPIQSIELNQLEKEVNQVRIDNGLPVLKADLCLRERARIRAIEAQEFWSHDRPNGERYWTAKYCGSGKVGENLAEAIDGSIVVAWLNSSTHKAVILNSEYTRIGIVTIGEYTALEVQE